MAYIPAKLLTVNIAIGNEVAWWDNDDGTGDPWIGYAYRWEAHLNVDTLPHSSQLTREAYYYNGLDIKVGDKIFNSNTGAVMTIVQITGSPTTSVVDCIIEDVDRLNTIQNSEQNGYGSLNSGRGYLFEVSEGMPILFPMPDGLFGTVPPHFFSNIFSKFVFRKDNKEVEVDQTAHGFVVGDAIYLDNTGYHKAQSNSTSTSEIVGYVTETTYQGPSVAQSDRFRYRSVGPYVALGAGILPVGNNGLPIYLSDSVAGGLTTTKPTNAVKVFIKIDATHALYVGGNTGSVGAAGPQGFSGFQGNVGSTGATGDVGVQGFSGFQGNVGDTGATGNAGVQGFSGVQGLTGNTGSAGADGATGAAGVQGFSGFQGLTGTTGADGVTGPTGNAGVQGFSGVQGNVGNTGATGNAGVQGFNGFQGLKGDVGDTGATGNAGVQGFSGVQGLTGTTGATGSAGVQGFSGFQGNVGNTGATGNAGVQGLTGNTGNAGADGVTGPTGNAGVQGFSGFQGNVGNTGNTGATGNAGVQGFSGVQGLTGNTGDTGATGNAGVQGFSGVQGLTGTTGATGNAGVQGFSGFQGNVGNTGATGSAGVQGFSGFQGLKGDVGDTGNTGATGAAGVQGFSGFQGFTGVQGLSGFQGIVGSGTQGFEGFQGLTGTTGVQGYQGPSSSSTGMVYTYSFRLLYNNNSTPTGISGMPSGWTTDYVFSSPGGAAGATTINLNQNSNSPQQKPLYVSYIGYRQSTSNWHNRLVTSAPEMTATSTTVFTIPCTATNTGSESGQSGAYSDVYCYFLTV